MWARDRIDHPSVRAVDIQRNGPESVVVAVNRHNYQRIDVPQDLESSVATETAHMYRLAVEDSFRRHGVNLSVDPPQTTH